MTLSLDANSLQMKSAKNQKQRGHSYAPQLLLHYRNYARYRLINGIYFSRQISPPPKKYFCKLNKVRCFVYVTTRFTRKTPSRKHFLRRTCACSKTRTYDWRVQNQLKSQIMEPTRAHNFPVEPDHASHHTVVQFAQNRELHLLQLRSIASAPSFHLYRADAPVLLIDQQYAKFTLRLDPPCPKPHPSETTHTS